MAAIDRNDIIEKVSEERVIAIVRGVYGDDCKKTVKALYDGGIRVLEFPFDRSDPSLFTETQNNIRHVVSEYGDRMLCGAGTVCTVEQVHLTKEAGGCFIVSPNMKEAVIRETRALGLVSMPGAMTPSEICDARDYGADFVKVFPAGNLGPGYIKAVRGPLNDIPLLAVGGISYKNVGEFLAAGCVGAGIGGDLVNKKWIEAGDFEKIREIAELTVKAAKGD